MTDPDPREIAAALRQVSRSLAVLADALSGDRAAPDANERDRRVVAEWGTRGLTRAQASALFRKHGLAPQAAGGWARGGWLRTSDDGLRWMTERSLGWLAGSDREGDEHRDEHRASDER